MRTVWIIWMVLFGLSGCTSTRSLSKKFSEKPTVITKQFAGVSYANTPTDSKLYGRTKLWDKLSRYCSEKDVLPQVPEDANIHLVLKDKTLSVTAYQQHQAIGSFEIPVRKRGKYLILQNRVHVIPIPFIYFEIKEDKTILAPLKNNSIGIHGYSDHTLWILFFGASNGGRSIHEYHQIKENNGQENHSFQ